MTNFVLLLTTGILFTAFAVGFIVVKVTDFDYVVEILLASGAILCLIFATALAIDPETRISALPTTSEIKEVAVVDELSSGDKGCAVTLTTESGKRLSSYLSLEEYGTLREGDEVSIKVIQKNGLKYSYTLYYLELTTSERCCEQIERTPKNK